MEAKWHLIKQCIGQEDQGRNQKIPWNKSKWRHNNPKSVGCWKSNPKREISSITGLSQKKQEKAQIKNLTSHLKELEGKQQTKPNVSIRKEMIKIRAEINEIECKKGYKR